jgi:hypothetical protein
VYDGNVLFFTFFTEEPISSSEEVSCPWNMGKRGGVKGDRLGDLGEMKEGCVLRGRDCSILIHKSGVFDE